MTRGRRSARPGRSLRRRPILLLTSTLLFAVIIAAWLGWNVFYARRVADATRARILRQEYLYGVILRLDEVLTMSARMNALLGERRWESRYVKHAPELDAAVAEASSFAASCGDAIASTATANDRLLELEHRSFGLVNASRGVEAQALLSSPAYEEQKRIYREGLDTFITSCRSHASAELERERNATASMLVVTFALVLVSLAVALRVLRFGVVRPLDLLAAAATSVMTEERDVQVPVTSDDAVGALEEAFNAMVARLGAQRAELRQRHAELEVKHAELEEHIRRQAWLLDTIKEFSTPLLPLTDGIIVLPLIGTVDESRAAALTQTLLHGVMRYDAHTAILDVTGISAINASVMRLLLAAAKAARLMGTRVLLAGLTPAMASSIVHEGIDVLDLETTASLRNALTRVLADESGANDARPAPGDGLNAAMSHAQDRVRVRVSMPHT
jgi:anti-anti-sigma regulatory factor/HAMP domain-containing protein